MRIHELEVTGFGLWRTLYLNNLNPGMQVFYGPNESGKTTLLEFIRYVLYGSGPAIDRYLPPVEGGPGGGSLLLQTSNRRIRVSRSISSGASREEFLLTDPNGQACAEQSLSNDLGTIDRGVYCRVFAVGLHELQELATLSDAESSQFLYDMSIGGLSVRLDQVFEALRSSQRQLWDGPDRNSIIANLLAERDRLRLNVDQNAQDRLRYGDLLRRHAELESEIPELERQRQRLDREIKLLRSGETLADQWHERRQIQQRLAAIGPLPSIPIDALDRLRELESRISNGRRLLRLWRRRMSFTRRTLSRMAGQATPSDRLVRLKLIQDQLVWLKSIEDDINDHRARIEQLNRDLEENKGDQRIGGKTNFDYPKGDWRRAARRLRSARRTVALISAESQRQQESATEAQQQVSQALVQHDAESLSAALHELGEKAALLRQAVVLDGRLQEIEQKKSDLEEESLQLKEVYNLSAGRALLLGVLFGIGVLTAVIGMGKLVFPGLLGSSRGWLLAIGGTLCAGISVFARWFRERSAEYQQQNIFQQLELLQMQLLQAHRERDNLESELPDADVPVAVQLHTAETEIARLEGLVANHGASGSRSPGAALTLKEAELELKEAESRWKAFLDEAGLPPSTTPSQLAALEKAQERSRPAKHELSLSLAELARKEDRLAEQRAQFDKLIIDAAVPLNDGFTADDIEASVRQTVAAIENEGRAYSKWRSRRRVAYARLKRLRYQLAKWKSRRRLILAEAGARDEKHLQQLAERCTAAEALREQERRLTADIYSLDHGPITEEELAQRIAELGNTDIDGQMQDSAKQKQNVDEKVQMLCEERGGIIQELKSLEANQGMELLRLRLKTVEAELTNQVHHWRVRSLAVLGLEETCRWLENNRQPETLTAASDFFQRMTAGRYKRVWTRLGERQLFVDSEAGDSIRVEALSQGTREQLFLCLRLALVQSYARRGAKLPLVLDDVLVNFDTPRAQAAAATLKNFAESGHQILFFTCHEHIRTLCEAMGISTVDLPRAVGSSATASHSKGKPPLEIVEASADETQPDDAANMPPTEQVIAATHSLPRQENPEKRRTTKQQREKRPYEEKIPANSAWETAEEVDSRYSTKWVPGWNGGTVPQI